MTDPLLSPFSIKHLTLRNRIASTSHEPAYAQQAMPLERYQAYHEEKARGGIGLTMIGGSANVDVDSPSIFGQLDFGRDEIVPHLRRLAGRVHAHGAAVMSQITHMGRRTRWDIGHFLPAISPSTIREPAHRSYPKSMEQADIDRVVRAFGRAAERAQAGGLDGVEVCAYAGHLVDQFWSPCQNVRQDSYGGSVENRARFALEVLSEIRRRAGAEFIVGIRMSADDHHPGGNGPDGAIAIGQLLAASGLVDFISVVGGSALDDRQLADQIPSFGAPMANYLDAATRFGKAVPLPILHAGRIADLPTARHALAMGGVDLVGMTRAHIADPHIVRKLKRGDESRIRPCVGASYCISRIYEGKDALCLHNPATGRESQVPQLVPRTNREQHVVVVGAGPGGLEAARAAAEAGHRVTLLDAASKVGGQLLLLTRASDRHRELLSIIDWLHAECRLLGVTLKLNTYVEATDVLELEPDTVIVATGGMPITPDVPGAASLSVSTWSALSGEVRPGSRVLVVDVDGSDESLAVAEYLASTGLAVQIATPDRLVGHDVGGIYYPDYLRSLYKRGVTLTPDVELIKLSRSSDGVAAVLGNLYSGERSTVTADSVVAAYGTEPMDELYTELVDCSVNAGEADLPALVTGDPQRIVRNPDGRFHLFRIGDAVAHRNVHAAMLDARRVVLGIGKSPDHHHTGAPPLTGTRYR
jgi:2,4-dienoyl-CoA reductase-like NADH-dependent reductase (Old Yellow Enzyme family)/thioredoxin reductase